MRSVLKLRESMGRSLGKNYFKRLVLCGNKTPRSKFKTSFGNEINQFIDNIYVTYKAYKVIDKECKGDVRKTWVAAYLYNAIHVLISAFNIFISGYIIPSGNLMRQFHESVAMSMLLSNTKLKYFDDYIREPRDFKVYQVFTFIDKHLSSFEINTKSWNNFLKVKDFYHNLSHPSALAVSSLAVLESKKNLVVLGSYYDAGKLREYKIEIDRMVNAADILKNIIEGITDQLNIKQ